MSADLEISQEGRIRRRLGGRAPHLVGIGGEEPRLDAPRVANPRWLLVSTDALAATAAWALVMLRFGPPVEANLGVYAAVGTRVLTVGALAALTVAALAAGKLYRARVCAMRSVELLGVGRAAFLVSVAVIVLGQAFALSWTLGAVAVGGVATFALLAVGRATFRGWLQKLRRRGESVRPVLLVGANREAGQLHRLVTEHPEQGLEVRGVIGDEHDAARHVSDATWLGDIDDLDWAVAASGVNGAIVASSALPPEVLNDTVRRLADAGLHVQLSSGLQGIGAHRLRATPIAHEPLFYLEPVGLAPWQLRTKRALDLVLASLVLLVALPVMLAAAVSIKLQDRGPVLFTQQRVGREGQLFTLFKFRTMVVDAEQRLHEVKDQNQRNGPLFKLAGDPRVTTLGRFLRAASIDELPQLWNVLRGEMSIVGPRPALPHEVAEFSDRLRQRTQVLPGITGLWQVEARDNPSFWAYERLDLYYVENWSVGLDLSIIAGTNLVVVQRGLSAVRNLVRRDSGERLKQPATVLE